MKRECCRCLKIIGFKCATCNSLDTETLTHDIFGKPDFIGCTNCRAVFRSSEAPTTSTYCDKCATEFRAEVKAATKWRMPK